MNNEKRETGVEVERRLTELEKHAKELKWLRAVTFFVASAAVATVAVESFERSYSLLVAFCGFIVVSFISVISLAKDIMNVLCDSETATNEEALTIFLAQRTKVLASRYGCGLLKATEKITVISLPWALIACIVVEAAFSFHRLWLSVAMVLLSFFLGCMLEWLRVILAYWLYEHADSMLTHPKIDLGP